ncbi:hypothetical protein ASG31_16200 [Chryseobacterium sp. Leaf404]|nr:hypothetical protein ASG31_16200 [Chryseobacterium sp. Leaf404]
MEDGRGKMEVGRRELGVIEVSLLRSFLRILQFYYKGFAPMEHYSECDKFNLMIRISELNSRKKELNKNIEFQTLNPEF